MTEAFQAFMKVIIFSLSFIFALNLLKLNTGWGTLFVIFLAIVLLTFIVFSGSASKKLSITALLFTLFLVFAIFLGLIETDLGDGKEKAEEGFFRVSYFEGDANYSKGRNWIKIQGGGEQSVIRIVSYKGTYFEISFDHKGNSSAYFQMNVSDLNSPPNLIYGYETVNFSETGGKYIEAHKKGGNEKNREILIKIVVPANTTVEITNFKVVSA